MNLGNAQQRLSYWCCRQHNSQYKPSSAVELVLVPPPRISAARDLGRLCEAGCTRLSHFLHETEKATACVVSSTFLLHHTAAIDE